MTEAPRLYRVIVQVADLDRAAGFYERLFGVAGRRIEGASRHYFDCGDVILALLQPRGENARSTPDYLYFAVGDLEAVHRRAKDLGALAKGTIHGESAAGEIATLKVAGWKVRTTREVLVVSLDDRPGELGRYARRLSDAGINIAAFYMAGERAGEKELIVAVDDLASARRA